MSEQHDCKFCGKSFEFASDKNDHESLCGVSRLSDYGIETGTFDKLDEAEFEGSGKSSRQLQLDETVYGRCVLCEEPIREQDKMSKGEDKSFFECPVCDKLLSEDMLQ